MSDPENKPIIRYRVSPLYLGIIKCVFEGETEDAYLLRHFKCPDGTDALRSIPKKVEGGPQFFQSFELARTAAEFRQCERIIHLRQELEDANQRLAGIQALEESDCLSIGSI